MKSIELRDKIIKKHEEYLKYLMKYFAYNKSKRMTDFETKLASMKAELEKPSRHKCIYYYQHGISCNEPGRNKENNKTTDCIGIDCGHFELEKPVKIID